MQTAPVVATAAMASVNQRILCIGILILCPPTPIRMSCPIIIIITMGIVRLVCKLMARMVPPYHAFESTVNLYFLYNTKIYLNYKYNLKFFFLVLIFIYNLRQNLYFSKTTVSTNRKKTKNKMMPLFFKLANPPLTISSLRLFKLE